MCYIQYVYNVKKGVMNLKILLTLLVLGALSSCVSTSNISAKYQPTPTPELTGYWFANDANQAQYLQIRADGTGEICWENSSEYRSTPVVISENKMITTMEGELSMTENGFDNCVWGVCAHYVKITENRIAAQCRDIFSK